MGYEEMELGKEMELGNEERSKRLFRAKRKSFPNGIGEQGNEETRKRGT